MNPVLCPTCRLLCLSSSLGEVHSDGRSTDGSVHLDTYFTLLSFSDWPNARFQCNCAKHDPCFAFLRKESTMEAENKTKRVRPERPRFTQLALQHHCLTQGRGGGGSGSTPGPRLGSRAAALLCGWGWDRSTGQVPGRTW